ncbi:hypothetical protein [Meiothermus sp. CFH 77666]|uniref:hypothetical protein n=1 Tax=Meiothermus sp. CFH 77666 TaxID=2817942 RepID=UPI001AA0120D|nr:hypothetical protein [Meiothermus sp. CFH 77666]MBO1438806.1 hypothetical protein [Meiothermus sp. CFH 77666]
MHSTPSCFTSWGSDQVAHEGITKPEAALEVGIPQGRIADVRLEEDGKAYVRLNTGSNTDEIYVLEGQQLIKLRDYDGAQKVFLGSKYLTIDQGTSKLVFRDIRDDRDILVSKFELAGGLPTMFTLREDWMALVNARGEVERWNLRTGQRDIVAVKSLEVTSLAMNKRGNIMFVNYGSIDAMTRRYVFHIK